MKTAITPQAVAEQLEGIIRILVARMSQESQTRAYPNLVGKLNKLNPIDLSSKRSPGGAPIGQSISIVKNILNGKDPYFIRIVVKELQKRLHI